MRCLLLFAFNTLLIILSGTGISCRKSGVKMPKKGLLNMCKCTKRFFVYEMFTNTGYGGDII